MKIHTITHAVLYTDINSLCVVEGHTTGEGDGTGGGGGVVGGGKVVGGSVVGRGPTILQRKLVKV